MPCVTKKAALMPLIFLLFLLPLRIGLSARHSVQALTIPAELLTSKGKKRNPAFAISAQSVLRRLREGHELVLIDVRRGKEFERFRIPGSINIPLFAVKTKAFLRPKQLVLVNEGYNNSQLEKECERLRSSGFRVWLLDGGLSYWRQKGAPLRGDALAQRELNRVPPPVFFAEKDYENWVVIDTSAPPDPEARPLIPQSICVPYRDDEEKFTVALEKTAAQYKGDRFVSVLIFNEKGEQYETIEAIVQEMGLTNVFFLKGGMRAYKEYLEQQALIRQLRRNSRRTLIRSAQTVHEKDRSLSHGSLCMPGVYVDPPHDV